MTTIKPASKVLFCKPAEAITQSKSGFFIPQGAAEKPKTAEVINVGDKVTNFKPKDQIVYKEYTTSDVKIDGKDYFLIDEEDVLGVLVEV